MRRRACRGPEDQPERVNQVDAHLPRSVGLQLMGPAEEDVLEGFDSLQFLQALSDALGADRAVGTVERGPAVADLGELLGLEEDVQPDHYQFG